ncbi:MAG: hypothetical protein H7Y30_03430 [Pyrinomonadaceae bacterium]|nr:hypothetical protein [Pyrinomonadaceae bacterium]
MKSIKDIYQWYESIPKMPVDMTSLQKVAWEEQNSKRINTSFEGEWLMASPAIIIDISIDKITAFANYELDYIILNYKGHEGEHYRTIRADGTPLHVTPHLGVKYEILYDKSIFYEALKLIQSNSMIELEGEIIKVSPQTLSLYQSQHISFLEIQLKLSQIKVIERRFLHADLLDDKLKFRRPPISSKCFIATAAFGNQDITEVIQLREFRDNFLRNSLFGRFLITIYGHLSPPVAYIIKQNNWLRNLTRIFLRKVVLPATKKIELSLKVSRHQDSHLTR